MKKLITAIILSVTALMVAAQQRDESEVVKLDARDPEMAEAIKQARMTLPQFLKTYANPPVGAEDFRLKVMVTDQGQTEHFWVTPFKEIQDGFAGVIANDPKVVSNVKAGQVVRFDRALISDWGYKLNGRQVGSYTICVLFKNMPADQASYYRKNHGFDC